MCSKSCSDAFLEHPAELVPERLVQLLVLRELRELLEDLAHRGGADVLHDPVLLEDLPADVQRQVLRVDDPAHEAQVDGEELLLALRDEHALDVQLHPGLVVVAVQVEGRRAEGCRRASCTPGRLPPRGGSSAGDPPSRGTGSCRTPCSPPPSGRTSACATGPARSSPAASLSTFPPCCPSSW